MILQALMGLLMLVVATAVGVALISLIGGLAASIGSGIFAAASQIASSASRKRRPGKREAPVYSDARRAESTRLAA